MNGGVAIAVETPINASGPRRRRYGNVPGRLPVASGASPAM